MHDDVCFKNSDFLIDHSIILKMSSICEFFLQVFDASLVVGDGILAVVPTSVVKNFSATGGFSEQLEMGLWPHKEQLHTQPCFSQSFRGALWGARF